MPGMTDRDTFAAAALTGLVNTHAVYHKEPPAVATMAYAMADAMLRERCRSTADCPVPDNAANLDAAPAARASEATASPERVRARGDAGTGDTQEIAAYARFVGQVMNWISEATSAYAASCSSDGGRKIMADACCRCWDAFDRIAYPTVHGASPEARASVGRPRTDKADLPTLHGTGDTPDSPQPIACSVFDRSQPIAKPTPVHTPPAHATPSEGSEQREGTEPVAWAVCTPGDGDWSPCFFHEPHAQRCASAILGSKNIVPLYRSPTLTDAEAETLRELRDEAAQYADEIGLCASEVRVRQRIIDGLLERLGGGR